MKKLILPLLLLSLASCNITPSPANETSTTTNGDYTIKVIDSCEYIEYDGGLMDSRVYTLTHKGNCKFCAERNKRKNHD